MSNVVEREFRTIGSYPDDVIAAISRARLEEAGVEVVTLIQNDASAMYGGMTGGVELSVPAADAPRAAEILGIRPKGVDLTGPNERERRVRSALRAAWIGFIFPPGAFIALLLLAEVAASEESLDAKHQATLHRAKRVAIASTLYVLALLVAAIVPAVDAVMRR